MTAPIRWRDKLMLFKLEDTYGTDPTPTGAANAILPVEVQLSPMQGTDSDRETETPYLGNQGGFLADLHRTLSFKMELEASGTAGTAPAWGPLLRACGVAETIVAATSVSYTPVSDDHEAGTFYLWVGNTLFTLTGARGTAKFQVAASGVPYIEFSFTGLYAPATATAQATPDFSAFLKPKVASKAHTPTFTIDGDPFVLRSFELDLGNQVEPRFLIGEEEILIVDRSEQMKAMVKAVPLGTFNPFALAEAQTEVPVQIVHGTAAGKITTIDVPTAQVLRVDGLENAQGIVEWPLRFAPIAQSGDDQFTITLT